MQLDAYDTAQTTSQKHATPLVFIHGAWCGKWVWLDKFVPYFEKLGYRCLAMDLRGHGESEGKEQVNKFRIEDYVEDVQSVARKLGDRFVVIGHSMGGAVVERFIQKYSAAAAVLIAPPPPQGVSASVSRNVSRMKLLRMLLTKNTFLLVKDQKLSKVMFFTKEMADEDYEIHYGRLGNESYSAIMELNKPFIKGDPNHPFTVPVFLIGASKDGLFTPDEIKATANQYDVTPVFFDGGHVLMLEENWKDVAGSINDWLISQGF